MNAEILTSKEPIRLCIFQINNHAYGIDIRDIKEVSADLSITPICHAPKEIEGYVNVRGNIFLVANLRVMLGLPKADKNIESCILYIRSQIGENFGILVDDVTEVITVDPSMIEQTINMHESDQYHQELCQAACIVNHKVIAIVNTQKIFDSVFI